MSQEMSAREIRKTEAGAEYQTEILTKEVKRLRKNLTGQISKFETLIQEANPNKVKQELEKLGQIFAELCSVSSRLLPLASKEQTEQIQRENSVEESNVGNLEKAVKEWLEAQLKMETKAVEEGSQGKNEGERDDGDAPGEEDDSMHLTVQLMKRHSNLEKQISLVEDLMGTGCQELIIKEEIEKLQATYREVCDTVEKLQGELSSEERKKIRAITATAETRVKNIMIIARERDEADKHSMKSLISGRHKRSLQPEVAAKKSFEGGYHNSGSWQKKNWRADDRSLRSEPTRV